MDDAISNISIERAIEIIDTAGASRSIVVRDQTIRHVIFENRNMEKIQFINCKICGSTFRNCSMQFVRFNGCNISAVDFRNVDLSYSEWLDTYVNHVNMPESVFLKANFRKTHIFDVDFSTANMSDINIDYTVTGLQDAPEGDLVMYGKKHGWIVTMLIPKEAKRSWATTRKLRAEYVKTLEIDPSRGYTRSRLIHSSHRSKSIVVYEVGKMTYPDSWDDNRWNECSHGIHGFLDKREAVTWSL